MKTYVAGFMVVAGVTALSVVSAQQVQEPKGGYTIGLRRYSNLGEGRSASRAEAAGRQTRSVGTVGPRRCQQRLRGRLGHEARRAGDV